MRISVDEDAIRVYIAWEEHQLRNAVKKVADREYRKTPEHHWRLPHTPWHARRLAHELGTTTNDLDELGYQDLQILKANRPESGRRYKSFFAYQASAVEFGNARNGRFFIGDDVGLGKTIEALGYLWYSKSYLDGNTLIVAPASVIYKWKEEIEDAKGRFAWSAKLTAQVVSTSTSKLAETDCHIMSYDIMRRRLDELLLHGYNLFILDESHYIKEGKSKRTKAARSLGATIPKVIALSGTPILNRPIELWSTLNLLDPQSWPTRSGFGFRYGGGITSDGTFVGATHLKELSGRLRTVMIRRLKHEVLSSLPPITVSVLPVDVDLSEYTKVERNVRESILALSPTSKGRWVQALDRLTYLRGASASAKLPVSLAWAVNFLESTDENKKLVIYAHHKATVQSLRDGLVRYGVRTITGGDSKRERHDAAARFQRVGEPRCLIISSAGSEGIDLYGIGGADCSDILFAELQWRPSDYAQAWGRLHRQGQPNSVNAWILQANGTIDHWMTRRVDSKADVINRSVGDPHLVKEIVDAWSAE
jgi:SWI/SNF-related matrix-associated actin-dependent regulator 1 of chromatin subfamily A